ncbi:GumC family protein [Pedobacter rhodius]|uniref:non-specific protein-tyrosine kinase n=1 Tax=Pedobacter rhodius TaxID=3004098 RepID=A0ABT4KZY6_9SPHI|nr:tyrosine-protein kinase [Pedobacter sp. SJ11]MCZ4224365.1 polysaccharide biosynthesis tyrosine autokinase [Pedobacter sp. SJ11]
MHTQVDSQTADIQKDDIDFKNILHKLFEKWSWFLVSVIFFLVFSFFYLRFTVPQYQINSKLLVNDNDNGSAASKKGSLMDLGGLIGASNSVDNETEILKTRFLMEKVVRKMQLNIIYYQRSNFINEELYSKPFKLNIIKSVDTINFTAFNITKIDANKVLVKTKKFEKQVFWNQVFNVAGVGSIMLTKEPGQNFSNNHHYVVKVSSLDERVATLMQQLSVKAGKQATIIDLGLSYPIPKKGEDILNELIAQYTAANIDDKNAIADSTGKFIKERLTVIASELGDQENQVKDYKQRNQLSDMSEQGKLLVQNTGEFTNELARAETQISIMNDLESYLKDESKNKRVFPSSLLPQDMVFSNLMNQYNSLLIERDRLLISDTEDSPFIKNLDLQISGLRRGVLSNIQSTRNTYLLTRNKLRSQLSEAEGQIRAVPEVEKNYLKLARNKDIKQELYIFLMQKAEETAISKTSNISVAKTIDPPKSQVEPISPKKNVIYFISLIMGFVIPIVIILLANLFNTSINTKVDIEALTSVPVIGEINHNESSDNLIVANQGRSAISEQFRALRTNLSFYLKSKDEKVILLTSSMSGEGKSFTAINLANIFALSGKKVLLMELDLRKPGLSSKLGLDNRIGFSNYTINPEIKISDIIKPISISTNMFIISSGPLPPNPAETLLSDKVDALITELKKQFDYIIMDAPPIGVITDAQLLVPYSNAILYLVRQKVTKKDQLSIVDDLYKTGKMKNIGIVVNDISNKEYGYGYGYGTYGEEKPLTTFQKIIGRFKV